MTHEVSNSKETFFDFDWLSVAIEKLRYEKLIISLDSINMLFGSHSITPELRQVSIMADNTILKPEILELEKKLNNAQNNGYNPSNLASTLHQTRQ